MCMCVFFPGQFTTYHSEILISLFCQIPSDRTEQAPQVPEHVMWYTRASIEISKAPNVDLSTKQISIAEVAYISVAGKSESLTVALAYTVVPEEGCRPAIDQNAPCTHESS